MSDEIRIDIERGPVGYRTFIECKRLPSYRVEGRTVVTDPISYAAVFGGEPDTYATGEDFSHLMDFQAHLTDRALSRRRFGLFEDCGLGKTIQGAAWAMTLAKRGKVLILCPLAVFKQIKREFKRFHDYDLVDLRAGDPWMDGIAILNYESRRPVDMHGVIGVWLDESQILRNDVGETRAWLCDEIAPGIPYRLTTSATPAPNDHAEYASHAVFLGYARSSKEFYSQFFRKDGVDWVLRGHAIDPFYRNLSTWCTYIQSPRALGFKQTTEMDCEPEYDYRQVPVHDGFTTDSGKLFPSAADQEDRSKVFGEVRSVKGPRLSLIAEYLDGRHGVVWCARNAEESAIRSALGKGAVVINGNMPVEQRVELVDAYRAGDVQHIVSKPRVLGIGVNLPECNHMVYSGFTYSFEEQYQAVRRGHRYGRVGRLQVLFPYTTPEAPILAELRAKQDKFQDDVRAMQARFWR